MLYGIADGEAGTSHTLGLLPQKILAAMVFLGCASLDELDTSFLSHDSDRPDTRCGRLTS